MAVKELALEWILENAARRRVAARVRRARGKGPRHKGQPPESKLKQMLRHEIAPGKVVDPHQIKTAPLGKRTEIAVQ